ncbi:hypothetical protein JCM31826_08220 [Thermaurantimonas aggregans]|uniref:Acyltransferase n=1 Tax=Thermaurantimonas aggregans TaxID=2173829 RepID=A0A401XK22_9FLAO|nr:acyltransferase [Thermaurantimonas aggregans]GCD77340.1 hypothetical protein JCM31826_08220 [Thermaurantimonas aggregans]
MKKLFRLLRYDWPLHFVLLLTNWLPDNVVFIRLRGRIASPFFKKCGKNLGIGRHVTFYQPSSIEIGDYVYIAYGCWFQGSGNLKIGDQVLFGPYVVITTSNHTRKEGSWRFGMPVEKEITVEKGAWIGSHCTILAGSIIRSGSVIGANTVVAGEVKANSLFAGVMGSIKKQYEE